MKTPRFDRKDVLEILSWLATAFLVLALVNGFTKIVPIHKLRTPDFVRNLPTRPRA